MWKWLLGIFVVLAVVCGGGGYYASTLDSVREKIKGFQGVAKPTTVKLETAEKGTLTRTVSAPGTVDARTKIKVSAQVSARITALPFREIQDVKSGDVVARLDAVELQAALDASRAGLRADEARLEGTQAALARARADLERVKSLVASKDRSAAELEAVESAYLQQEASLRVAEESIESSRAQVRRAERDLANSVIVAPIDGTITRLNNEVGEMVLGTFNNLGQVIMEIADLSVILMRAEVDEANVQTVKAGQTATVFITAYPDKEFRGRVDKVRPQRQVGRDGKNYFETEIELELGENERLMLLGGQANCDIAVETMYDVVKVPSQAVLDRRIEELPRETAEAARQIDAAKARTFARVVYRVVEGKAVSVPVSTGSSDLRSTVILSGLSDGDRIITGPYKVLAALKDGQVVEEEKPPVKPVDAADGAAKTETGKGS